MSVILCGPPMSGKTYYGKRVSAHLNCPFIDTDDLIEERYASQMGVRLKCREIALKNGEEIFRKIEKEVVSSLSKGVNGVIAVGGGTLIDIENVSVLKSIGRLIFLKTESSVLNQRLNHKTEPLSYIDPKHPVVSQREAIAKRNEVCLMHAWATIELINHTEDEVISLICNYLENCDGK